MAQMHTPTLQDIGIKSTLGYRSTVKNQLNIPCYNKHPSVCVSLCALCLNLTEHLVLLNTQKTENTFIMRKISKVVECAFEH
uniref:Uncharacterized protein n=1 Tax=Ciona intestinalis TaxID=7719 RepID=Q69HR8_CIOIN|nr:hypothetical protein cihA1O20 [Ciona intestinalis]